MAESGKSSDRGRRDLDAEERKGCGLCAAECPCGAIEMEPELA